MMQVDKLIGSAIAGIIDPEKLRNKPLVDIDKYEQR
jgi:hypothetical protein